MTEPKTTARTVPEGKLLLDDLWLDEAETTLCDIARRCEQEFGHKPSLEDFRQLLRVKLRVGIEDYFSDGETLEVTEVIFKTKMRPAAQRYTEGDVFAIPLDRDHYAFGRIMRCLERSVLIGVLVEIFRETSSTMTYRPSIVASGRLLHPTSANPLACLKNHRWTIVASDDTYRFPESDQELEFTIPDPRRRGFAAMKPFASGSPSRPLTTEEWRSMEANGQSNGLGSPEALEDRIRAALIKEPKEQPPS